MTKVQIYTDGSARGNSDKHLEPKATSAGSKTIFSFSLKKSFIRHLFIFSVYYASSVFGNDFLPLSKQTKFVVYYL